MTFEQKLKEILKVDLGTLFGYETEHHMRVRVANDSSNDALDYEDSLLCLIKTGQGLSSTVKAFDAVSLPLFITFYFDYNFKQTFLSEIKDYLNERNAKMYSTEIDGVTTYYKIDYDSPFVSSDALIWFVKESKKTIKLSQITLVASCLYSTQLIYDPEPMIFKHNGTSYNINNVVRYAYIGDATVDASLELGKNVSTKDIVNYESTFDITIMKSENDTLVTLLKNNVKTPIDQTKPMYLNLRSVDIPIQKITVTETFENAISYLNLVLTR